MDEHSFAPTSDENDFEYIFDEKTRGSVLPLKKLLLVYGIIVVAALLIGILLEYRMNGEVISFIDGIGEDEIFGVSLVLGLPLLVYAEMKPERKCRSWLFGQCKVSKEGIYLKQLRKNVEFVPWSSIVAVERKQMNLDRSRYISVICCYRSLTGKALLEHALKQAVRNPLYKEYYGLWDEVVTLGYTKARMAKIRAFQGTGMSKGEKMQQLQNGGWSAYESNRDL